MHQLKRYGVSEHFLAEATLHPEETLARVTAQYRGKYKIVTEQAALLAEVSGKLRYETEELAQYPTVGDYVMVTVEGELAVIHRVLRRKSLFVRRAVGVSGQAQPVASEDICDKFEPYFSKGQTCAFIGSSGVGKSTLINCLLGAQVISTQEIGKGDKGRHTTTGREMFPCPLGGVVIDTPGMREMGAESADLSQTFGEIEDLARHCRFRDCTHTNEPGCAVLAAVEQGRLDQRRLDSYRKLEHESSYEGLSSKEVEVKKAERMFKEVGGIKQARRFAKEHYQHKQGKFPGGGM